MTHQCISPDQISPLSAKPIYVYIQLPTQNSLSSRMFQSHLKFSMSQDQTPDLINILSHIKNWVVIKHDFLFLI